MGGGGTSRGGVQPPYEPTGRGEAAGGRGTKQGGGSRMDGGVVTWG